MNKPNRTASSSRTPIMTRFADLAKGLAALIVIGFLVVGVPLLLIGVVGMPFGQMISDLTDPLTSQSIKASAALRLGLSAIVWLAWLQIAWALLVELTAAVRGRSASPSRLVFPGFQRSARQLVAVAMLVLTVFSSPAAASLAPLGVPDAAISSESNGFSSDFDEVYASVPSAADRALDSRPSALVQAGDNVEYTVRSGDTFWSLAEEGLGDGFRWREIRDLNGGRVVGDGVTITDQTENLQPGWVLRLPGEVASALGPSTAATTATASVDPGDHFWSLAKERLTDEWGREPTDEELTPYWAAMVERNQDRLLPPGDPDLVYAGQQFEFPPTPTSPDGPARAEPGPGSELALDSAETTASAQDVVSAGEPTTEPTMDTTDTTIKPKPGRPVDSSINGTSQTSAAPQPSTTVASDQRTITSEEETHSELGVSDERGAVQSDPADAEPADADDTDPADDADADDGNVPVGLVAISGVGLVTAAIGGIIGRSQARQLGVRRPGTNPEFDVPSSAKRLITETSDGAALDELDIALRHLGAELAAADLALPDLVGALIEQDTIRLLVATPHNAAPQPFQAERNGMVWVMPRPVPPLDVRQAQNPYPLLVAVGFTESAQLLIDLEYIGALGLNGGFADVVDVMGTMALQLATSPLADTIDVMCVGFGEELADLERITVVPNLEAGLNRVEVRAEEAASLAEVSENTGPAGRALGVGDWTPLVVFDPLSDMGEGTDRLLADVNRTAGAGVSAAMTASEGATLSMELSEDRVSIPAYGVNLDRRALTRTERTALSTAVERAKRPAKRTSTDLIDLLQSPAAVSPLSPRSGSDANVSVPSSVPVRVRVLGPLRIEDQDGELLQFARSATPEFLAYLTHHRDGIEVGRVMNTLWPSTTARRTWIANVHADAGRTLSAYGDGVTIAPKPDADDEYRLSDQVGSDLALFRSLVAAAVSLPLDQAVGKLTDALMLVEGVPYANITSRWPINEGHWQEATVMVDEAARCIATLALDHQDNPSLAEWATAKGLLASPQSTELHRLRLRAAIALDNRGVGIGYGGVESLAPSRGVPAASIGLSPDAVFQHYQAVAMADDHRPEGGSHLDPELVELYDSYRRAQLATSGRSKNGDSSDRDSNDLNTAEVHQRWSA